MDRQNLNYRLLFLPHYWKNRLDHHRDRISHCPYVVVRLSLAVCDSVESNEVAFPYNKTTLRALLIFCRTVSSAVAVVVAAAAVDVVLPDILYSCRRFRS